MTVTNKYWGDYGGGLGTESTVISSQRSHGVSFNPQGGGAFSGASKKLLTGKSW